MLNAKSGDAGVAAVVRQYLDTRRSRERPISTRQALVALRAVLPTCDLSDRELVDIVAKLAVMSGRCVDFDNDDPLPPTREGLDAARPQP